MRKKNVQTPHLIVRNKGGFRVDLPNYLKEKKVQNEIDKVRKSREKRKEEPE